MWKRLWLAGIYPIVSRDIIDIAEDHLRNCLAGTQKRPFVAGICGAQGSGKSSLVSELAQRLSAEGMRVAAFSLDDLYLTRSERLEKARVVHPLFAVRGVPGTHDVALGLELLHAFSREGAVAIPAFDKLIDDRVPRDHWRKLRTPVDTVLFEGWCVGAVPETEHALRSPINALETIEDASGKWRRMVNFALGNAYQELFAWLDTLILLKAPSFDVVATWRAEQEATLRDRLERTGQSAGLMEEEAIRRFVSYYERLTKHILTEMTRRAALTIPLDERRRPHAG